MGNSYEDAKTAIMEMFNDRSYTREECRNNLSGLVDEIDILIDCVSVDISNSE